MSLTWLPGGPGSIHAAAATSPSDEQTDKPLPESPEIVSSPTTQGNLQIHVNAAVARVMIYDKHDGQAGSRVPLHVAQAGIGVPLRYTGEFRHNIAEVTVVVRGKPPKTEQVQIKPGEWTDVRFELDQKAWTHSSLVVRSHIRGARIFIDDHLYGTTWAAVAMKPGTYTIRIVKKDFEDFKETVELHPGKAKIIEAELKPLISVGADGLPAHFASATCPDKTPSFGQWLEAFKSLARASGISPSTLAALDGIKPNRAVLQLDRRQSEYTRTFFGYLDASISPGRIARGKTLLKQHARRLDRIEKKYGVPPEIIVSLWGMETSYGANIGNFPVFRTVATLAHQGRRSTFFCSELYNALFMIESARATKKQMIGSWAGAMGQPQFMPSTFVRYGADGDGDGRIDIWKNLDDVFESAANYLFSIGWRREQGWGSEVLLPKSFDPYQARLSDQKPLAEWRAQGVSQANAHELADDADILGSIILPAGITGPAFLVYNNFRKITEWNRSLNYALTVAHLADRLAGKGRLRGKAPANDRPLSRKQIMAMQEHLNVLGFEAGEPDGMIGVRSRAAIREFQRHHGIPADAYPTPTLTELIRREAALRLLPHRLSKSEVRQLQQHLTRLGLYRGDDDGINGPLTQAAILKYQHQRGMRETGRATTELLARIAAEPDPQR